MSAQDTCHSMLLAEIVAFSMHPRLMFLAACAANGFPPSSSEEAGCQGMCLLLDHVRVSQSIVPSRHLCQKIAGSSLCATTSFSADARFRLMASTTFASSGCSTGSGQACRQNYHQALICMSIAACILHRSVSALAPLFVLRKLRQAKAVSSS